MNYDNDEEQTPHWVDMNRKPSRYGLWINGDFIGPQRLLYLEKEFVNRTYSVEQILARDTELNPFEYPLVFRRMIEFLGVLPINLGMNKWKSESSKHTWNWNKPPKEGDGSWHIKMTLYDPDGENFEISYRTKCTNR